MTVIDFSDSKTSIILDFSSIIEVNHEYREEYIRSGDGLYADSLISKMCSKIRWKPQDKKFQLPRSIPLYGICPTGR